MGTLNSALSIAIGALMADQSALNVTTNNVANADTPGYSRQRAIFSENPPMVMAGLSFGAGVKLEQIESIRDPILQLRIEQETQQQGANDAFVSAMQQIEVIFNQTSGGDIATRMSAFFSSVQQLSTDPMNQSLRQNLLTSASNLASSFRTAARNLTMQKNNVDLDVTETVEQVNILTTSIAKLNGQIKAIEDLHENAGTYIDQRDEMVRQLSQLVDLTSLQTDAGLTLTTNHGTALVSGQQSFALSTQPDISGVQHIFSQGADVTSFISSGKLAGLLAVRDSKVPALLSGLDTLAAGFASAINAANRMGTDLNGNPGVDIFVPPPAGGTGAASTIAVQMTDPSLVAASSDGTPRSNANLANFTAVHDQPIISGQTPTEFYSNLVFNVGTDLSNAQADQQASELVLNQLQDQRGSISGVSLDEEAANMLRYQRAYEAAARVVSTVNEMMEAAVNLGRY